MIVLVAVMLAATVGAVMAATAGAAPITEFNLPAGTTAASLTDGPDGALWFGGKVGTTPELGRITTSGAITSTPLSSTADFGDIAIGAGGTIWFTLIDTPNAIGERSPSGPITLITPGIKGLNTGAVPNELAEGANGAVWFLDHGTTKAIGEITPSGTINEYPTGGDDPDDLTVAPNGTPWFTVFNVPGAVGFATPGATTGTPATEFPTGSGTMPAGITADGDGNLWFSDQGTPAVGQVTVTPMPPPTITEHGSTDGLQPNGDPDALTPGPGGNVWFDDQLLTSPAVGKITSAGKITEYPLSDTPWDLTVGIDGNLWLPQGHTKNGIDRVTPAGKVDLFSAGLNPSADIYDGTNIVSGPDGNLWFIDIGTPAAIVRADVQLPPTVTTGAATNVTASSAQIGGSANGRGAASTVTIQYGTTPALASTAAAGSEPADDTAGTVSATLTKLPAGSTIYYRLVASNAYGTVSGTTLSFTTAGTPPSPGGLTKTLHARTGNQEITVTLPATPPCLPASSHLPLTLNSVSIPGSKAAKLTFRRAAVFIDRGIKRTRTKLVTVHHRKRHKRVTVYVPNATARHVPVTLSPSLHGLHTGTHALRLPLTYGRTRHVGHHTVHSNVTKTIKTTFAVC